MTERQTKHINKLETEIRSLKEKLRNTEGSLKDALASLDDERERARTESNEANAAMLEKEVNSKV